LGVVVAVVVVVVPEELELLDESSFFAQEMMMRLKRDMRIMDKTLFIFSSIPKVKYYGLVLGEPNIYHDSGVFYKCVGILLGGCLTVKK
jgi:hypothetical protein